MLLSLNSLFSYISIYLTNGTHVVVIITIIKFTVVWNVRISIHVVIYVMF